MHPLVIEAMRKTPIAWIVVDGRPAYPVWCLWIDDALHVVSGGDEQPTPGLAQARRATVSTRGDHGGRVVAWTADVEVVAPGSTEWTTVAPPLAGKRLNVSGTNDALVESWTRRSRILRLRPIDDEVDPTPTESGAAPPRDTPATRRTANPFRLHRIKRR